MADTFPTVDLDQTQTTLEQDQAATRVCHRYPDPELTMSILGLDGHEPRTRRKPGGREQAAAAGRSYPARPAPVPADPRVLPPGWYTDPVRRAEVHREVLTLTAAGLSAADIARRTGLSSRGVQRVRTLHRTKET